MTPTIDDITSFVIALVFLLMALVMFYEATLAVPHANAGLVTGIAALTVGVIYCIPLFFNVSVVDLRGALRVSLIVYGVNYLISHYQSLFAVSRGIVNRVKTWKSHRN